MMASLDAAIGELPAAPMAHQQFLPEPEASHAEVLADKALFERTLKRVQLHFGIDEKVPKLGGRDLDLQELYRNVTSLGGCDQVIASKQWRDAAKSFNYPDTITSVSYQLRKAYTHLLWDYEQVYFFRASGLRVPSPAASSPPNGSLKQEGSLQNGTPNGEGQAGAGQSAGKPGRKKRKAAPAAAPAADVLATSFPACPEGMPLQMTAVCTSTGAPEAGAVGSRGVVTLDARFDAGYMVSVAVGQRLFRGMLYYPPPEPAQALLGETAMAASMPQGTWAASDADRKAGARAGASTVPKPHRTPFNFFSGALRDVIRAQHPQLSLSQALRKVAELWQRASAEERAPYGAAAAADQERYHAELEAFNYRLAAQQAQQSADAAAERARAALLTAAAAAAQPGTQQQQQQQQAHMQQHQPQQQPPDPLPASYGYPAAASAPLQHQQQQQHHQLGAHMQMQMQAAAALAAQQQQQQQQAGGGLAQHMHAQAGGLLQQMGMAPPNLAQHMGMAGQGARLMPPAALQFPGGLGSMHAPMGPGGMGSHQQ